MRFLWVVFLVLREADGLVVMCPAPSTRLSRRAALPLRKSVTSEEESSQQWQLQETVREASSGAWSRVKRKPYTLLASCLLSRRPLTSLVFTLVWQATLGDRESRLRVKKTIKSEPSKVFLSTPLTAAFVGWLTNWVGVKMLFYPIAWRGWKLAERIPAGPAGDLPPFGLIGWQGIVAAKAPRMARDLVNVVTTKLVSPEAALKQLSAKRVADFVDVPEILSQSFFAGGRKPWENFLLENEEVRQALKAECRHLALGVAKDVRQFGARCLDLETLCVRELSGPNVKALIDLFQQVGKVELRFLVNSGIFVGFFLGLVQSVISASLSPKYFKNEKSKNFVELLGSGIVGAVTNWIALLWIFAPVEPLAIFGGLFTIQGKFLQRQAAVSQDFAKFFATRILTAHHLLTDLLQSTTFRPYLRRRIASFSAGVVRELKCVGPGSGFLNVFKSSDALDFATDRVATVLPDALPEALFEYTDATLDLSNTIGSRLAALPPRDFERLLHPIFEEDEATLIAVGGLLGIAASYLQLRLIKFIGTTRRNRREARLLLAEEATEVVVPDENKNKEDPPAATSNTTNIR